MQMTKNSINTNGGQKRSGGRIGGGLALPVTLLLRRLGKVSKQ